MALPKLKLEYVSNSTGNWTQAVTPDSNDAVIMVTVDQSINTAGKADIILSNRSTAPESSTASDAKGNLSDVFTDFQRIRLVDQQTGIVIFVGRIYRIRDKYDLQYGNTIRMTAFDALKELAEYPIEDPPDTLKKVDTTSSNTSGYDLRKRSQVIKYILNELDLNDNVSVTDTDHFDDSWNTTNLKDKNLDVSKLDRYVLGVIQDLALADPVKDSSATAVGESGYDFRIEPYFTSLVTSHKPVDQLNYFQRGTRPGRGGSYSNETAPTLTNTATDSLTIEYPNEDWTGESGLKRAMLATYEFDKPKNELYTSLVLHYEDSGEEDENANQEGGGGKKEGVVTFEFFKGSSLSGTFTWADKALDASKNTPNIPELLNISNGINGACRVQWQNTDSNYLLVSNVSPNFPTADANITLTGASSGATFVMNPATARMSTKYGVKRPLRLRRNGGISKNLGVLRNEVASRLVGRTDLEIVRGKFQTIRYPYVYHDLINTSTPPASIANRSGNTITWTGFVDAQLKGIRKGHVVAEIDSSGNYTRYSYISAVNSTTSISYGASATDTSDGTALDSSNTIRFVIPLRPGDVIKTINAMSNIESNQLILELGYDESPGMVSSRYTTIGSNNKFNNIFNDAEAIRAEVANATSKQLPERKNLGETSFFFDGFINRGVNPSSANDYRQIHWTNAAGATSGTAGTLIVGDGSKFTIACANSVTLTTAEHTIFFRPTSAKASANTSDTTFQIVLTTAYKKDPDDILVGWCKASDNKRGAKAVLVLVPQFSSKDLFASGQNGTLTEALLSKSAQEYTSDLELTPITASSDSWRQLTWAAATLSFADGDSWTILVKSGSNYSTTSNGSSFSNITAFAANSTYYAFIDTADTASGGNLTLRFTTNYNHISVASDGTFYSSRVLLALIAVPAANAVGYKAPRVFPMGNRSLTINAAAIAAESITATHITATAIDTTHLKLTGDNGIGGLTSSGALNLTVTSGSLSLDNTTNGTNKIAITSAQQTDFAAGGDEAGATTAANAAAVTAAAAAANLALGMDTSGNIKKNVVVDGTSGSPSFYSWSGSQTTPGNLVIINAQGIAGYTGVTGTYSEGSGANDGLTLPASPEFQIRTTDGKASFGGGICTIGSLGVFFPKEAATTIGQVQWEHQNGGGVSAFYKRASANNLIFNAWGSSSSAEDNAFIFLTNVGTPSFNVPAIYAASYYSGSTSLAPLFGGSDTTLHSHAGSGDANQNAFAFIGRSGFGSGSTVSADVATDTVTFNGGSMIDIVTSGDNIVSFALIAPMTVNSGAVGNST